MTPTAVCLPLQSLKAVAGIHSRAARWASVVAFGLFVFGSGSASAQPSPEPGNLPIFTSPIDVTGLKVQLRAVVPDRDSGSPVDIALPVGFIGPKMSLLLSTPLSAQIDQYWNTAIDPATGMTVRQAACDAPGGIKDQVAKHVADRGPSYSAYDISCNLSSTGQLLVKQVGSTMYLAYLLTGHSVSFASTSPDTCRAGSGTPFCPNDPRFTVRFATEIVTVVRTPGLCAITAENGTAYVVAANFEAHNAAADVAKFFSGQKFVAGEVAMTNTTRHQPLPLDAAFKELRTGDGCTGRAPGVSRLLAAFRDLETSIDMHQGIILRAIHAGIAAPSLDAPNPGGASNSTGAPGVPSFTRPMLSTAQPLVTAGTVVQAKGLHFPPTSNLATALPLTLQHGGYGQNSVILGGVCFGGATELEWGPVGGQGQMLKLPGDAQGRCAGSFAATNLMPNTTYHFRARDCDPITCSPRSATLTAKTAPLDPTIGKVVLRLDAGVQVGTATIDTQGSFDASVTIPPATSAGAHVLHAISSGAQAEVGLQVAAAAPTGGSKASIMMVGVLRGETGCPNHPIDSTQTDDTFMLFGAGFAPGAVTVHLDSGAGPSLGTAAVRPDGTICQKMQSAPGNSAGRRTLVATQNGAVVAQKAVTFVLPSGVR